MLETSESDIHGKNDSGLGQGGRGGLGLEEGHWCGWGVLGWVEWVVTGGCQRDKQLGGILSFQGIRTFCNTS